MHHWQAQFYTGGCACCLHVAYTIDSRTLFLKFEILEELTIWQTQSSITLSSVFSSSHSHLRLLSHSHLILPLPPRSVDYQGTIWDPAGDPWYLWRRRPSEDAYNYGELAYQLRHCWQHVYPQFREHDSHWTRQTLGTGTILTNIYVSSL